MSRGSDGVKKLFIDQNVSEFDGSDLSHGMVHGRIIQDGGQEGEVSIAVRVDSFKNERLVYSSGAAAVVERRISRELSREGCCDERMGLILMLSVFSESSLLSQSGGVHVVWVSDELQNSCSNNRHDVLCIDRSFHGPLQYQLFWRGDGYSCRR